MEHRVRDEYKKLQNVPLTDDHIREDLLCENRRVQGEQIEQWLFFCIGFLLLAWVPNLLRDLAVPTAVIVRGEYIVTVQTLCRCSVLQVIALDVSAGLLSVV